MNYKSVLRKSLPFIGLALVGQLGWHVYDSRHRHAHAALDTDSSRAPATASGKPPATTEGPPICQNFYKAICQKRGETRDPTGVVDPDAVGEITALRSYEDIIREHRDWSFEQVDEALVQSIYTPKRVNRMKFVFDWVKRTLVKIIDSQPETNFTRAEKKTIKERLRKTMLQLPPPASAYSDEPDLYTKTDVFYERSQTGEQRMRVGGAYLISAKSQFNIIFTVAHELSHAIDPCEMKAFGFEFPAYERVSACFAERGIVARGKGVLECGENDQLSEAFADWMAVKVTAEALKTFSTEFHGQQVANAVVNAVRDLCEQDDSVDELDTTEHPTPQVRIERIFGHNPEVRELVGCAPPAPETPPYCAFDSPNPEPSPTPTATPTPTQAPMESK